MKKLAPHDSKRTGLAPGPWAPRAFTPNLSSSDLGHPLLTEWLWDVDFLWDRPAFADPALYLVSGGEGWIRKDSAMAEGTSGAALVDSLEIGAVAGGVSAGRISVRLNVAFMKADAGIPGYGMERIDPPEMALRARWASPANTVKVGPMA